MSGKDGETRTRVLNVATRLFAARGFEKVTVREICREANANIAAVNYHFRDKMGLYLEVLGQAIELMKGTLAAATAGGQGRPADAKLRIYVEVFLRRVVFQNPDHWIHQLMMHELADPSPALDQVINAVIKPRMEYLAELVGTMLGLPPTDMRVIRCVLSVQAQCHGLINPVVKRMAPDVQDNEAEIMAWAEHIAQFSLNGIQAAAPATGRR
jgi:TetR/AcrR family transcriptional regulator, regulator of cefoperazone and chloramphenicol sensitivity